MDVVLEEAIGSARRISPRNKMQNMLDQMGLIRTTRPFHTVLFSMHLCSYDCRITVLSRLSELSS